MSDEGVTEAGTVMDGEVLSGTAGEKVGEPMAEFRDDLRRARELIPAEQGIAPINLAQLVDAARDMARARFSIPEHFHGNPGDCLAIIDIANRANLSPYMLAMETYVDPKTKKLAFMSRAYHALAQNWLIGDLDVEYRGEGESLVCIVRGRTKKDPQKIREHESPPLGEVRPKKNSEGVVKGSPLWARKPKVQLAYDTVRDWVRLHCPQATLGVYTPDELEEYEDEMAAARRAMREEERSGVSERLANGQVDRSEGHRGTAHVQSELAQIAPASPGREIRPAPQTPAEPVAEPQDAAKQAAGTKTAAEPAKPAHDAAKGRRKGKDAAAKPAEDKPQDTRPDTKEAAPPETPAETTVQPDIKADASPDKASDTGPPSLEEQCAKAETWQAYLALWDSRLKLASDASISNDWKRERSIREKLKMPSEEITEFRTKVDKRSTELAKKPNPLAAG